MPHVPGAVPVTADRDTQALVETVARQFHEAYERLAPEYGYETRRESAVPWENVPEQNKALMRAVVAEVVAAHCHARESA
jgi:hypothetical protein